MSDDNQFVGYFSDDGFWEKIVNFAKKAGKEVIKKGLWLYYAAQREDIPAWAKAVIYGALGYFILPLDAIPDVMPGIGFTDDLGVLAAAITTVASYIDDSVKELAREKIAEWFD